MFITYDCLFLCLLRQMELVQECLKGVLVIHKQSLKNIQHTHSESLVFSNIELTQTITLITPISMRVLEGHCKIWIKVKSMKKMCCGKKFIVAASYILKIIYLFWLVLRLSATFINNNKKSYNFARVRKSSIFYIFYYTFIISCNDITDIVTFQF